MQPSEKEFQGAVLDLARQLGWLTAHFNDSRRQIAPGRFVGDRDAAGFPDLVLVRERVIYAELKKLKGRVSQRQRAWIAALRHAGQEVYLWFPDDWHDIQQVLSNGGDEMPNAP